MYCVEPGLVRDEVEEILLELGEEPVHAFISIGAGSSARLALRFASSPEARGRLGSSVEIDLAPGSSLELSSFSALGEGILREALLSARIGEGAIFKMTEAVLDQGPGVHRAELELAGRKASVDFAGAYAASGRTAAEHEISMRHSAPLGSGRISLASVLAGSARLRFTGLIHVLPGASGTDAYLSNRNLILDDGARAESLPQLRIEHDDVKCSHGSTSGGPDPEEIFYLQSRGLDFAEARSLIAMGRLSSVFARFPEGLAAEAETLAARIVLGRKTL